MKKILAVLLTIAMLLCSFCAFAEEEAEIAEIEEVNWTDFEPYLELLGLEGEFVTFDEIAVQVWVPTMIQPLELTEEDLEEGYIGYYANEDQSMVLAIMYVDADGLTLDAYMEYLAEDPETYTDCEMCVVNGYDALTYMMPGQDSISIAFTTEAGYVLELTFVPVSNEELSFIPGIIFSSIQATEEAETEEVAE